MTSPFQNSVFYNILRKKNHLNIPPLAIMGGVSGSRFFDSQLFLEQPIVIFDFETTGLDVQTARIIEIGGIKFLGQKEIARFSRFVNPGVALSKEITQITGIQDDMLKDALPVQKVLPDFHDFLRGSVGVAHNAEFDVGMLFHESNRIGIGCDYTVLCSLKMARSLVKIERRNLDALAKHYGLSFESRHRSIGDILVTAGVLWKMLAQNPHLRTMADFLPYREYMPVL